MAARPKPGVRIDPIWTTYCTARMWSLVAWETAVVWRLIDRMGPGLLPEDHPWVTGADPADGAPIWSRNLVYRSPSRRADGDAATDRTRVENVGAFLARMVAKSATETEIPQGKKRRMPHAVNYLHGAVHYNGVYLVFDGFADLIDHLSDPRFRQEVIELAHREAREVTFVFRERHYDPLDYAYCIGAVRTLIPWFSNGNGPTKKPVLWGNVAPFPAIGTINGAWMADTRRLAGGDLESIVRPPVSSSPFAGSYRGARREPTWLDRFVAWTISVDVRLHGFGGQLAFTKRDVIEPERRREYRDAGGYLRWSASYVVPHPFEP